MKKIINYTIVILTVLSISLIGNTNTVLAKEIDYDLYSNIKLIPDEVITNNMIDVGENYAKEMSTNTRTRMDGELWTLQSASTVVSHGPIKASFGEIVPVGESRSKTCSWSVSVGTTIKGYKLASTVSGSKTITQNGPSSNQKLADKKSATHRSFFSVGYGRLVKYTYKITQKYTGVFIRNETKYLYADVSTESCSQLIQLSGSTVYAENLARTKVKNAGTLSNYKNKFSKIDGSCLYYYKW